MILENCLTPFILGDAWFEEEEVVIDYQSGVLIFGSNPREQIPFITKEVRKRKTFQVDLKEVKHSFPNELEPKLHNLIQDYNSIFNTEILQQTSATFHGIDLIDYTPFKVSPYALTPSKSEFAQAQIKDMLVQQQIRLSDSPYNSPIVVVEYKDGTRDPRFCIDYSKLNKLTLDTNCPAVNIHELVRKIGSSKVFCKIDLKKGYWQIPLTGDSKPLTAFTGPDGIHYEFNVMPFGLKGAPGTFIRLMNMVLSGLIGKIAEVYLDDILVHAATHEELLDNLLTVFSRLRQHQLTVHLKKCEFGVSEVTYLGHVLTAEHNSAPTAQVLAIQETPVPRTKKELLSFLGSCNWLRLYLPRASEVLSPLHAASTRKTFKWTQADQEAFDQAKTAFGNLQPLHRPDRSFSPLCSPN